MTCDTPRNGNGKITSLVLTNLFTLTVALLGSYIALRGHVITDTNLDQLSPFIAAKQAIELRLTRNERDIDELRRDFRDNSKSVDIKLNSVTNNLSVVIDQLKHINERQSDERKRN